MYLMNGANVKADQPLDADIADIAPTVYAFLGVPIPDGLDGRVIQDAFSQPLDEKTGANDAQTAPTVTSTPTEELSADEEDKIRSRLADLGYLE